MEKLIAEIKNCTVCLAHLPHGCRPVLTGNSKSKILVIGQAPGSRVHASGIPWDDKSGENLRSWLNVSKEDFYNEDNFAIVPMGFCYPGTGKSGDLPPRKECAPLWHEQVLEKLPNLKLTLLIGTYAQAYYLKKRKARNLTRTCENFHEYLPEFLPLPHPSPRNNIWQKKNPWFKEDVLPVLKAQIETLLK